jgi:hypothetical protein
VALLRQVDHVAIAVDPNGEAVGAHGGTGRVNGGWLAYTY